MAREPYDKMRGFVNHDPYPEHAKMHRHSQGNWAIREFLYWLRRNWPHLDIGSLTVDNFNDLIFAFRGVDPVDYHAEAAQLRSAHVVVQPLAPQSAGESVNWYPGKVADEIFDLVSARGQVTSAEILSEFPQYTRTAIAQNLTRMVRSGRLARPHYGCYTLPTRVAKPAIRADTSEPVPATSDPLQDLLSKVRKGRDHG